MREGKNCRIRRMDMQKECGGRKKTCDGMVDGIIFDVDGTLWDVRKIAAKVWEDTIREVTDWPITFDMESLGATFGMTMDAIFFHFYPESTIEDYEKISGMIYKREQEYLVRLSPELYAGVEKTLSQLSKGYRLYIVTNAQRGYIETLFKVHDIQKYFTDWMCFGDTMQQKSETIKRLIKRNGIKNPVYIGDTQGDFNACAQAGIPMVYASYGLGKVEKPWKSIAEFRELTKIFAVDPELNVSVRNEAAVDTERASKKILPCGQKICAVIFDLDGTLLNTLEDLKDSVNYVLGEYGMPKRSTEEIRNFVGNGVGKLMERSVLPGTSKEQVQAMLADFKKYYAKHSMDSTKPYPEIRELLGELKKRGYKTAVVSNKLDSAVKDLCGHFFDGLIDIALGESAAIEKKPEPDMINAVLNQLECSRADAVYVGDSEVDIATAANAGMRLIMVEWGFRSRGEMEKLGARCFITEAKELLDSL